MSALVPPVTGDSAAFWDATREQVLVLPWCRTCERPHWFPRSVCPDCLGTDLEWRPAAGEGEVHAVSVHHRPGMGRTRDDCPYVVALVELAEGVRMLANVVGCRPDDVAIGDPVRVAWQPLDDGRHLVAFTPRGRGMILPEAAVPDSGATRTAGRTLEPVVELDDPTISEGG